MQADGFTVVDVWDENTKDVVDDITCLLSQHLGVITGRESEELCLRRLLNYLCLANHVGISSTFPPIEFQKRYLFSLSR
jgi:hypothetical protein